MSDANPISSNVERHFWEILRAGRTQEPTSKPKAAPMPMEKKFQDKVAIVAEATERIGFSIAEQLASSGANLVIASSNGQKVSAAVEDLKTRGVQVFPFVGNLSAAQNRKKLIDLTIKKFQRIDVIVSNAFVRLHTNDMLQTEETELNKLWECYFKEARQHLQPQSSVVFVSSIAPDQPWPGSRSIYNVTKTLVIGFTEALAKELKGLSSRVRVNSIIAGNEQEGNATSAKKEDFFDKLFSFGWKKYKGTKPKEKIDSSMGVAERTLYLASDDAHEISGEVYVIQWRPSPTSKL